MIRKFSASCTSEYIGRNSLTLFFNIISLHLDALSPSLFQFAYPFKIEVFILVPQVLIYCIYDTFIASEITYTKASFELLGTDKSQKGLNLGNTGDEEGPAHSVTAAMAACDLWADALSCKSRTPRVTFLSSSSQSPDAAVSVHSAKYAPFIVRPSSTMIIPWFIQKDRGHQQEGHHLLCWRNFPKFLRRVWARVLLLQALLFRFRIKVMDQSLTLGQNLVHEIPQDHPQSETRDT